MSAYQIELEFFLLRNVGTMNTSTNRTDDYHFVLTCYLATSRLHKTIVGRWMLENSNNNRNAQFTATGN
jgi:hypothetical protein